MIIYPKCTELLVREIKIIFGVYYRIKVNREVFIVLIQNNIEVLHLDYGRFGIIIAVK